MKILKVQVAQVKTKQERVITLEWAKNVLKGPMHLIDKGWIQINAKLVQHWAFKKAACAFPVSFPNARKKKAG